MLWLGHVIFIVLFGWSNLIYADKLDASIKIEFLDKEQTIPQILKLQKTIPLAANPKELSAEPASYCFQANIKQQELLLREFYSYFLQYNAEEYLKTIKVLEPMAPLARVYAPKIKDALNKHDIKVLTVS